MESGSTQLGALAAMVDKADVVDVSLALVKEDAGWRVQYGEIILGADRAVADRTWRYPADAFIQRRLSGPVVAGLLRGEPQRVADMVMATPTPQDAVNYERLASQAQWNHKTMPWPRTEWAVSGQQTSWTRPRKILMGDGPSFVHGDAAFCAFFHQAAPNHNLASTHQLWRVVRLDRRAWIHRVTIGPAAMTVLVKGTQLDAVHVELTTPTTRTVRPLGRTRRVRLRLPGGLVPSTLLMLRRGDDWLDLRYFPSAAPSPDGDTSVVWDLPGAHVGVLIAGGEGPYTEFKRKVPEGEERRNMLKTVAAFATGDGGTIVVGVEDDTQVIGVEPTTLDAQTRALQDMIRNMIVPAPPFAVRSAELSGKTVLLVEVSGGGASPWYAYKHDKPEFYLRRGASTVPARMDEIGIGFGYPQQSTPRLW
jgi:hypothetical protein